MTIPTDRSSNMADWSLLPQDIYVTSAKSIDGIGFDVQCCSVPMVTVPEVRYRMVSEEDTQLSGSDLAMIDQAWENHKFALSVATVVNDNQPGRTAIIEITIDPPTLPVGTKLYAGPKVVDDNDALDAIFWKEKYEQAIHMARNECTRRGIDPDDICADGGVTAEMVVAKETDAGCGRAVIEPWQTPAPCGGLVGSQALPLIGESANDQGEVRGFKWFDHECRTHGCQSLVWKDRYEAAVKGRAEFRNACKAERAKVALLEARLAAAKS